MIDFEDEILEGEPRYRVRDADGNLIYDNVSIELVTPVRQEGTPLNKALFDSIEADYTEFRNKLTSRAKLSNEYSEWAMTQEEIEHTYVSQPSDWTIVDNDNVRNKINNFSFRGVTYSDNPMSYGVDGNGSTYTKGFSSFSISHPSLFKVKKINAVIEGEYSGTQNTYFSLNDTDSTLENRVSLSDSDYSSLAGNGSQNTYYVTRQYGSLYEYQLTRMRLVEFYNMTYTMQTNVYTFEGLDSINEGTVMKIRIPLNADDNSPTVLRIAGIEQYVGWELKAGGLYEFVYLDGELKNITVME